MKTYLFWATLRVQQDDEVLDVRIMRGHRAASELEARRSVLNSLFASDYQVVSLELDEYPEYKL